MDEKLLDDYATINDFLATRGGAPESLTETSAASALQSRQRGRAGRQKSTAARARRAADMAEEREDMIRDIFAKHDVDRSGYLDFKEMAHALREMIKEAGVGIKIDVDTIEKCFDKYDADGNGRVDISEFISGYNHFVHLVVTLRKAGDRGTTRAASTVAYKEQIELTDAETELVVELMAFDDPTSKASQKQRATFQREQAAKKHDASGAAQQAADASQQRVAKLLHKPVPSWPDAAHRKLSDMFMEAMCGDRLGGASRKGIAQEQHVGKVAELHIDSAKMDQSAFTRLMARLLGEGSAFLVPNLWADAIEGDADGLLSFQEACKFFLPLNSPDVEVRAAFMFDMYDKDDSGAITLAELAEMVRASSPGSLVEQDLLGLARLTTSDGKPAADERAAGRRCGGGAARKVFLFDDYLSLMKSLEAKSPDGGIVGTCRKTLGLS